MNTKLILLPTFVAALFCSFAHANSDDDDAKERENDRANNVSMHGTDPVTNKRFEDVNLLLLVDPESRARAANLERWPRLDLSEKYDLGFRAFDSYNYSPEKAKQVRNDIQERILGASERRCGRFEQYLRREHSKTNFSLGLATTITAALGALMPGLRGSQNLAGTAAVLSGARAEYNDAYFSNLTVSVIMRGIAQRRTEEYTKIRGLQSQDITNYPLNAAVKDAVSYDALCSTVTGLEKANDALTKVNEPGLDAINRTLVKTRVMNALAKGDYTELRNLGDAMESAGIHIQPSLAGLGSARPSAGSEPDTDASNPALVSLAASRRNMNESEATTKALVDLAPDAIATEKTLKAKFEKRASDALTLRSGEFAKTLSACVDVEGKPLLLAYSDAKVALDLARSKKPTDSNLELLAAAKKRQTASALEAFSAKLTAIEKIDSAALRKFVVDQSKAIKSLTPDTLEAFLAGTIDQFKFSPPAATSPYFCK